MAIPRKAKKPTISVMLVTNGPGGHRRVDAEPVEGQGNEDPPKRREEQTVISAGRSRRRAAKAWNQSPAMRPHDDGEDDAVQEADRRPRGG